jgi:hypothetical protein
MTNPTDIRLAFRVEGPFWNVYIAGPDTMDDAILLASIRMTGVKNPEHREQFKELMKLVLREAVKTSSGLSIEDWAEQTAPEHERK